MSRLETRIGKLENQSPLDGEYRQFLIDIYCATHPGEPVPTFENAPKITIREFFASCTVLRPKIPGYFDQNGDLKNEQR